jgi:C-terminal domain 6 of the ABC-three component (ABC-3C) systems
MSSDKNKNFSAELTDIGDPSVGGTQSSAKVLHGKLIPPQQQILLYSADEWEIFVQEWAHYQKTIYHKVVRFAGANDMGVDVAAFVEKKGLRGIWDNYQCKHYKDALTPKTGVSEAGKIIWHIFKEHISCPRKYYFLAPKDCGISLKKLLLNTNDLKVKLIEKWDDWCGISITSKEVISLEGEFKDFVDAFDFEIFTFKTALDAIDEHRNTPYHASRFGGGLPDRPQVETPPQEPEIHESRYIEQLFEAYTDHKNNKVENLETLEQWSDLADHYHRQREYFYYAESLRNFARDTVPPGTFDELQAEVHAGVVDIEAGPHLCALTRLNSVTQAAAQLPLTANGLISVTKIQDKKGICHQLANDDKLTWKKL